MFTYGIQIFLAFTQILISLNFFPKYKLKMTYISKYMEISIYFAGNTSIKRPHE